MIEFVLFFLAGYVLGQDITIFLNRWAERGEDE